MDLIKKNRSERILPVLLLTILFLVALPNAIQRVGVSSSSFSFSISSQSALAVGQSIDLKGTICPSPSVFGTITETVNYTGPSGQVVTQTEQQSPYGQTDYCTNPVRIDTKTFFNDTGTWQVQAEAQWVDTNDNQQSATSNLISFNVVSQQTTSTSTTSSSSLSSTIASSSTSTSSSSGGQNGIIPPTSSSSQNVTLNAGTYASISVNITEPSYMGYFAISSLAPVEVGVLSPDQYYYFTQYGRNLCDGSSASYSETCGQSLLNGLLILPGSYYLTVYSPQNSTEVYFGYDSSLTLQVENASTYVGAFINASADASQNFYVHDITIGSASIMQLFGISTQPVNYEITDLLNSKVVFKSSDLTTTNLNGTMPQQTVSPYYDLSLPPSLYQISVSNDQSTQAEVYFEYQITPAFVNPYTSIIAGNVGFLNPTTSMPMGVTSYGTYNNSGLVTAYPQPVMTQSLAGYTSITSIQAFDVCQLECQQLNGFQSLVQPYPRFSNGLNTATNQLNGVLVVNNTDGSQYVYWIQNVLGLNTTNNMGEFKDDIFNFTGDNAVLIGVTNSSGGTPSGQPEQGWTPTTQFFGPYSLPLQYRLFMTEESVPGTGVVINMSDSLIKGFKQSGAMTFDRITIPDPHVETAYFYVSGNQYTPAGIQSIGRAFYDAENVITGGSGAEQANFTALSAQVSVSYWNSQTKNYTIFPSAYSFGGDTGETDGNAYATYDGNGLVGLSIGTPNWQYIYSSSSTGVNPSPSSNNNPSPTGNNSLLETVVIAVVVVAAVVGGLFFRKRRLPPPPPSA